MSTKRKSANYQDVLETLREKFFLDQEAGNASLLLELVEKALKSAIEWHGEGPHYPRSCGDSFQKASAVSREVDSVGTGLENPSNTVSNIFRHMGWSVKAFDPYMVKNVLAPPNFVHLATYLTVSLYMPNAVTGEDSWDALNAELYCARYLSKLARLPEDETAGVFTFGWTGTNLYAFKIGLHKAFPGHHLDGLPTWGTIIWSKPAHYCHQTWADWIGIWQKNYVQIPSNPDQTTDLVKMREACESAIRQWKTIVCLEVAWWTTSWMGIDDIETVFEMRNGLVNEFKLPYRPHIHVDSVIGWAYLFFLDYDFSENPSGFSGPVLERLKKIATRLSWLRFADSFWVDFHKTWYMPYNSSMIIVRDKADLLRLRRNGDMMTPLFHDDAAYNPGQLTLETSRSSANILATWMSLRSMGSDGYRALLWHSMEISEIVRSEIRLSASEWIHIANPDSFWPDVFVRCYLPGTATDEEYVAEFSDTERLNRNDRYMNAFAKWLLSSRSSGESAIAVSKSSAALYTATGAPMHALRIYPLNPNATPETARELVRRLVDAKREYDFSVAKTS